MADLQEPNVDYALGEAVIDNGTGVELEDIVGDERITDPFNPALIRVDTRPMTIDLLLSRIEHEELDLQPSFQRKGGIWNEGAQSRLIESILIRIPLPAFYSAPSSGLLKRYCHDPSTKPTQLQVLRASVFSVKTAHTAHGP